MLRVAPPFFVVPRHDVSTSLPPHVCRSRPFSRTCCSPLLRDTTTLTKREHNTIFFGVHCRGNRLRRSFAAKPQLHSHHRHLHPMRRGSTTSCHDLSLNTTETKRRSDRVEMGTALTCPSLTVWRGVVVDILSRISPLPHPSSLFPSHLCWPAVGVDMLHKCHTKLERTPFVDAFTTAPAPSPPSPPPTPPRQLCRVACGCQ